jgi:hypothetical protein
MLAEWRCQGYKSEQEAHFWIRARRGNKGLVQLQHGELCRIENLITELAIALNAQNIQVDVAACLIYELTVP